MCTIAAILERLHQLQLASGSSSVAVQQPGYHEPAVELHAPTQPGIVPTAHWPMPFAALPGVVSMPILPSIHSNQIMQIGTDPVAAVQPQSSQRRQGLQDSSKVRRTVYITELHPDTTESQLLAYFNDCGVAVDCRLCGDKNSAVRFAFIEFVSIDAALRAIGKNGSVFGRSVIRVAPSKTAIVPVNNQYLPRSSNELEAVARTVFVANIDRAVDRDALRDFFSNLCGPVMKIRVLGDMQQNTKIAFLEFNTVEAAQAALLCSGAVLGMLPLRVSPSKTPVRGPSRS